MRRIFEIMYKELVLLLRDVKAPHVNIWYLFLSCHPDMTGERMDPSQPL